MNYAGILEPLLASVERGGGTGTGRLAGQKVVTPRKDISVMLAVDGEHNVHFLLAPAPADDGRFRRFDMRSLSVKRQEWRISSDPVTAYLDLTCTGGTEPAFRRPFLSLCEDLLVDLERPGIKPEEAAFRTCTRWQRFWSQDESGPVSVEWVRGLIGELLFLEKLLETVGTKAVYAWTGPEAQDHDFQALSRVAFEVKVSATVPYTIECNLNQLDSSLFETLYLVCFQALRSDDGIALSEVIDRLETALEGDAAATDALFQRLHKAGYRRQRRSDYANLRLVVDAPRLFHVSADFPRITTRSFRTPLDARIRGIRYIVQLSGLDGVGASDADVLAAMRRLV